MKKQKTNKITKSSQSFVPIKEIKDGIVILEDGTLVSVSLVSSVNLSLKSAEEQNSTIASFQNFLNLLEFSVQINIQSRKLDIQPYLEVLEGRLKDQTNELIKIQTIEYISFIEKFTESINVMDKSFFLVVSYKPMMDLSDTKGGFLSFFNKNKKDDYTNPVIFEEARNQLEQRSNLLNMGLRRTGVKIKALDSEALIELYYSIFNPGEDKLESGIINNDIKM